MKITRRQLRKIIREAVDIMNAETGELIVFSDYESAKPDAPAAAAKEILKRLKITPTDSDWGQGPDDPDPVETLTVEPEDYAVIDVEIHGKRHYRHQKKERSRLNVNTLLKRLDQWAVDTSRDYSLDNPGMDMQGVARDLAAAAEYEFEPDEWDTLIIHFEDGMDWESGPIDGEEDLIDYIASAMFA